MLLRILDLIQLLVIVWMIGFSGDRKSLRIGGFLVLAVKWTLPYLIAELVRGGPPGSGTMLLGQYAGPTILGGYLIYWAVRSELTVRYRVTLAVAGLIALKSILFLFWVFVIMSLASLA